MSTETSTPTMEMINDLQALILQSAEITTAISEILSTLNERVTRLEEELPVEEIFKGTLKTLEDI